MRVTRKLVLAFVVGMSVVLLCYGYITHRRTLSYFEADVTGDVHSVGHAVKTAVARAWRTDGAEEALRLIDEMNERGSPVHIRWVWLDALPGDPHRPRALPDHLRRAGGTQELVRRERNIEGEERLYTYFFMDVDPVRRGALEISESLSEEQEFARSNLLATAATLVVMAIVCSLILVSVGVWLVGSPMRKLVQMARQIGAGDLSFRLALKQRDEISDLAGEMNQMAERLARAKEQIAAESAARLGALEQLRHADRLTTVGKLASGIAHELGSPLQVLSGRAKMIASGESSGGAAAAEARIIAEQSDRMAAIIRQLLDFARQRTPEKSALDLRHAVAEAVSLLEPLARKSAVSVQLDGGEEPLVAPVDETQLQQVVTNLVMNAIQAMPHGGSLTLSMRRAKITPPADVGNAAVRCAWIMVRDDGVGIRAQDLPHIFDPFFTTKQVGEGTGLGLPVAHGIVREHGGWITAESEVGRGSTFTVYLPAGDGV